MTLTHTDPSQGQGRSLQRIDVRKGARSELDEFAYIVSHDVRNTARALVEVPTWLREDLMAQGISLDAETTENLVLIERYAVRLDRMFQDLLTFSRVGRLTDAAPLSLSRVLMDVQSQLELPGYMTVEVKHMLPDAVLCQRDAELLFECSLLNTAKHGGPDPVTLGITGWTEGPDVTLQFADTGPGIPGDALTRMFRPMTTLRRRDEVEGSGMGLAILDRITRHYGGHIDAGPGRDGLGLCLRLTLCGVATDGASPPEVGAETPFINNVTSIRKEK